MKEKLRKEIKEKRRKHSKEEQRKKSKEIKKRLFELNEFKEAEIVLFYISYNGEVFTHDMIMETMDSKKVAVPISNKNDNTLFLSYLEKWDDVELGSYDILEPKKEKIKPASIKDIDLIIVPGVGFDIKGNRIGHGKGYYDRLLKNSNALKVGLAFEFQIKKDLPIGEFDIPVDIIITEKASIRP